MTETGEDIRVRAPQEDAPADIYAEDGSIRSDFLALVGAAIADRIEDELAEFLERAPDKVIGNDDKMDEALRRIARQVTMEEIGKKPEVTVVVSRLMAD